MQESLANNKVRIALDAMGSDFYPNSEIQGTLLFLHEYPNSNVEICLIGKKDLILSEIKNINNFPIDRISIVDAEEVITMNDDASSPIKNKKNSSIGVGLDLLSNGKTNAFVSAGNTGAVMATGTIKCGRIKGVSRPTIGSFFPTLNAYPTLVLDVGANAEIKPKYLLEFAIMGSIYLSEMYGIKNPKIGLLNIGEEPSKGTQIVQDAHKILRESSLNFIGNVEGRDIFPGVADVVVCDGFTGNIVLKLAESFITFFKSTLKNYADISILNKIKVALMAPTIKDVFKGFDYQDYGGVPLLGVNGVVIIGHGKSTPIAIKNMIKVANLSIEKNINKKIEDSLNNS